MEMQWFFKEISYLNPFSLQLLLWDIHLQRIALYFSGPIIITCFTSKIKSDIKEESKNYTKSSTLRKPNLVTILLCIHTGCEGLSHVGHFHYRGLRRWPAGLLGAEKLAVDYYTKKMDSRKKQVLFSWPLSSVDATFEKLLPTTLITSLPESQWKKRQRIEYRKWVLIEAWVEQCTSD